MSYKSFDLLKEISFVRTGGSIEELKAANILKNECEKLGVEAVIESFEVDGYEIKTSSLVLDNGESVDCCGVDMGLNQHFL